MSISPQSLSRTRDKRSLRIPRKFEDFSLVGGSGEVPPEVTNEKTRSKVKFKLNGPDQYALALKMKGKASKRQTFVGRDFVQEPGAKKTQKEDLTTGAKPDMTTPPKRHSSRQRTSPPTSGESNKESSSRSSPSPSLVMDLECNETAMPDIDKFFKIREKPESETDIDEPAEELSRSPSSPNKDDESDDKPDTNKVSQEVDDDRGHEAVENVKLDIPLKVPAKQSNKPLPPKHAEINVKKNPFYPSITISNGCRIGSGSLLEKEPLQTLRKAPSGPPVSAPPNAPRYTPRRKSAKSGQSLMAKPWTPFQPQQNNLQSQADYYAVHPSMLRQLMQVPQRPTFNPPQNMQYGTRLMRNEPIYLPRSVAPICPITTTLQQIVARARQAPFLTKKAEICLAYQDSRKFDQITATFKALVGVTKHLELRDLLNLRSVSKTWKSIVDSDAAWERVRVRETRIADWKQFFGQLSRYRTKDLFLEGLSLTDSHIVEAFNSKSIRLPLKTLKIRTVTDEQNKVALELLCALNCNPSIDRSRTWETTWEVRVGVDDYGVATVPIRCTYPILSEGSSKNLYVYQVFRHLLVLGNNNPNITKLVELSDLEELFNGGKLDQSEGCALRIEIKPI